MRESRLLSLEWFCSMRQKVRWLGVPEDWISEINLGILLAARVMWPQRRNQSWRTRADDGRGEGTSLTREKEDPSSLSFYNPMHHHQPDPTAEIGVLPEVGPELEAR